MLDYESLEKLKVIYDRKGFLTLDDIGQCFAITNRGYCMKIMKSLVSSGVLDQVSNSSHPVKFKYIEECIEATDVSNLQMLN